MELILGKTIVLGLKSAVQVDTSQDTSQFEEMVESFSPDAIEPTFTEPNAEPVITLDRKLNSVTQDGSLVLKQNVNFSNDVEVFVEEIAEYNVKNTQILSNAGSIPPAPVSQVSVPNEADILQETNTSKKPNFVPIDQPLGNTDLKTPTQFTKVLIENTEESQVFSDQGVKQLLPSRGSAKVESGDSFAMNSEKNAVDSGPVKNAEEAPTNSKESKIEKSTQKLAVSSAQTLENPGKNLVANVAKLEAPDPAGPVPVVAGMKPHFVANEIFRMTPLKQDPIKNETAIDPVGNIGEVSPREKEINPTLPKVNNPHVAVKIPEVEKFERTLGKTNNTPPNSFVATASVVDSAPILVEEKVPELNPLKPEPIFVDLLRDQQTEGELALAEIQKIETGSTSQLGQSRFANSVVSPRFITAIVEAAAALQDRPIEVSFNPEELGRVRLTMQQNEGNMLVVISAERPETQDLLRRHIEVLANQLRELGYQDVTFDFSQQRNSYSDRNLPNPESANQDIPGDQPEVPAQRQRTVVTNSGRIDIRM